MKLCVDFQVVWNWFELMLYENCELVIQIVEIVCQTYESIRWKIYKVDRNVRKFKNIFSFESDKDDLDLACLKLGPTSVVKVETDCVFVLRS